MDRMWAPWRMEYVTNAKGMEGCFLCVDSTHDEEVLVVGRKGTTFAIMNKFPYTNGHLMVVPVRHVGAIEELSDQEMLDLMGLVRSMTVIFKNEFGVDGLNIGINVGRAAGAGLDEHVHIHMVPRWFGDTNFMPVLGDTRVISEHIQETWRRLKKSFTEMTH
jgi:ATP adenylyltransferase